MMSGWCGKITDAVGRRPLLIWAPLITLLARFCVVVNPTLNVLIGVRMLSAIAVPMYWLAFSASNADRYGRRCPICTRVTHTHTHTHKHTH